MRPNCTGVKQTGCNVPYAALERRPATGARRQAEAIGGMARRVRQEDDDAATCWLCGRPLGRRVEWHHPQPKSRGGRITVPVHPICHRQIHVCFSNADLARMAADGTALSTSSDMQTFLKWIVGKPPDFHAPTRRKR